MSEDNKKEYYAFISYKRENKKEAMRLQQALEYYRLPNNLRQENPALPEYVRPVFRDMTDLEVGELSAQIHSALEDSHYLIVVCSPRAATSKWVNDEVEYFISLGKQDKVIPYIIEGVPHANNPAEECFPPALLKLSKEKELLGANINEVGKDSAIIRVVSRMFNIRFDTLYQRYQREQKKRRILVIIAVSLVFMFLAGISAWIWRQNSLLEDRENKMIINQARAVVKNALIYVDEGDLELASALLFYVDDKTRKLNKGQCMPEIEHAFRVVYDSLLYSKETPIRKIRNFTGSILSASISNDDSIIVTGSTDGKVRFWDTKTGKEVEDKRISRTTSVWAELSPSSTYLLTKDYTDSIGIWRKEGSLYKLDKFITDFKWRPSTTFLNDSTFYVDDMIESLLCFKDPELNGETWNVENLNFSGCLISPSEDKLVFNNYRNGIFSIYDLLNDNIKHCRFSSPDNDWPHSLYFSPDGKYIVEQASGSIYIYDSMNGNFIKSFVFPEDHATNLSFGDNGNVLVVTSNYGIHFIDLPKMELIPFKYKKSEHNEVRVCALSNSKDILFIGTDNKRSYDIYYAPFVNNNRIQTIDTLYLDNQELCVNYKTSENVHFGTNTKGINEFGIVYCWWKRFRNEWEYDYTYNYADGLLRIENNALGIKYELTIPYIGNVWADGLHAYVNSCANLFATFNLLNLEIRDEDSNLKYNLKHNCELITASFSRDSKYVVTLTEDQVVHVWNLDNRYPFEIYNLKLSSGSYEYATLSDKNDHIYLVDYPSSESTERIIVKRTLLPPLGEVYSKLKSAYGNYMLTYEDKLLNFLEE